MSPNLTTGILLTSHFSTQTPSLTLTIVSAFRPSQTPTHSPQTIYIYEGTKDQKDRQPICLCDTFSLQQALKAGGQIWLLSNFDSQEDIAYPNDPRLPLKVDNDLKQLFRGIEMPRDMIDIERDLQKNGMKPATNTAQRRARSEVHGISSKQKSKKKKHEITKRTKLTNAHLPELFRNLENSNS
ncbi:hypothetical protein I3760_11G037300 [Carya illinoinensis]|nr:hypothetical protein I3760_11G037300 [Carya illinoinensis]